MMNDTFTFNERLKAWNLESQLNRELTEFCRYRGIEVQIRRRCPDIDYIIQYDFFHSNHHTYLAINFLEVEDLEETYRTCVTHLTFWFIENKLVANNLIPDTKEGLININVGELYPELMFNESELFKNMKENFLNSIFERTEKKGASMSKPTIEKVYFNEPYTIAIWSDKTKTMVKAGKGETYDPEKGLAMAICKKLLGSNKNHSDYYNEFKKWLPEEREAYLTAAELAVKTGQSVSTIRKDCARGLHPGAKKIDGKWMIPYAGMANSSEKED